MFVPTKNGNYNSRIHDVKRRDIEWFTIGGYLMKDLVSIIVPVYNTQKYLDRCLESLTNQSYQTIEIILVDDGSTDRSPEICNTWAKKDNRVVVVHKQNAGAGMARNTGLEHASGQYVLFVDSDDYVDRNTIMKCVCDAQKYSVDIVAFGRNEVYTDGRITPKTMSTDRLYYEGETIIVDILPGLFTYSKGIGTSVWGKLYNLELIRNSGIRFRSEREYLSEDACFNLELFSFVSSLKILPEHLYYYCRNDASLSRSYKSGHQNRNDSFCVEALKICEVHDYPKEISRCIQVRYHMYTISGLKRIANSTLSRKEKYTQFHEVFSNKILRGSLTNDILKVEKLEARIFWILFRYRLNFICYLLILYKAKRK